MRISGKMGVRFDEGAEELRQREREMEQLRERDGMFVCVCDCGSDCGLTVVFVCLSVGVSCGYRVL